MFRLYGTSACHLCEIAASMIAQQLKEEGAVTVEHVDIADSDALFERYGVRIPVLQHADCRELSWPFSPGDLADFLSS